MAAVALAFAWFLGIAAAAVTGAEPAAAIAASALLSVVFFIQRPTALRAALILPIFVVVAVAFLHYEASTPDPSAGVGSLNGSGVVHLRGIVDDVPHERPSSKLYEVRVSDRFVAGSWYPQSGRVLLRLPVHTLLDFGDAIEFEGKLETPEGGPDFDYAAYLLRRSITSIAQYPDVRLVAGHDAGGLRRELIQLRLQVSKALSDTLPEPYASLAAGTVLGSGGGLPAELRADMSATGTSHLVAVSGQNVSMLAAFVIAPLAWLIGRRPAALTALVTVAAYVALVGADASVIRAAIMGAIYVVAIIVGRQHVAAVALLYAAVAMTVLDPHIVHDVSFQLSFAATLGLMVMAPALSLWMEALVEGSLINRLPFGRSLLDLTAVTAAAIAFTLPITAINFGTVSLVSPLANLFVVPAFSVVAITSAVTAAFVLVYPGASDVMAWIVWPPAAYMLTVIEFFASWPGASVTVGRVTTFHAIAWYTLILAASWWLSSRPERAVQTPATTLRPLLPALGIIAVGVVTLLTVWMVIESGQTQQNLSVTVMDIGQGDAILIQDRSGRRVLVDGGPSGEQLRQALGRHMPFHDRRIDIVILTHPQADHVVGLLDVIDSYDVGLIIAENAKGDGQVADQWQSAVDASGISIVPPQAGSRIDLDGGHIDVLQSSKDAAELNDQSVVLLLDAGARSFLLTGDLGEDGESEVLASGLAIRADILKVGHHGSRFSSTDDFLARVQPQVSLISAGAGNPYGHPSPEVLERLEDTFVLRTDERGDVTISTDGERLWVDTQR